MAAIYSYPKQKRIDIRQTDPIAAKYIRPFLMGDEFINNIPRYCLWLKDSTAQIVKIHLKFKDVLKSVKRCV